MPWWEAKRAPEGCRERRGNLGLRCKYADRRAHLGWTRSARAKSRHTRGFMGTHSDGARRVGLVESLGHFRDQAFSDWGRQGRDRVLRMRPPLEPSERGATKLSYRSHPPENIRDAAINAVLRQARLVELRVGRFLGALGLDVGEGRGPQPQGSRLPGHQILPPPHVGSTAG